jgi:hypothetical protein
LPIPWPLILYPRPKCVFSEAGLQWYSGWGRGLSSERGMGGCSVLAALVGGGEGEGGWCFPEYFSPALGHKVPLAHALPSFHGRGPWILLHVVSGPWTSFVAALDKGQCRKALCKRHIYYIKLGFPPAGKFYPLLLTGYRNI